jgi:predicted membrane protein
MKKGKIAFWIVIFGFVGLIIYQNKLFFMAKSHLILNLGFLHYDTPELANAIFFMAFFLLGILLTYILSLFKQYKDAKLIKALKAKESTLMQTVTALEKELSNGRNNDDPVPDAAVDDEAVKMTAEVK